MAQATVYTDATIVNEQPETSAPCEDRLVCINGILLSYKKTHVTGRTCYYLMTEQAAKDGATVIQAQMPKTVTQYTFDSSGAIHGNAAQITTGTAIPKHRSDCGYDIEVTIDYYIESLSVVTPATT